jgi:hypothetical protein
MGMFGAFGGISRAYQVAQVDNLTFGTGVKGAWATLATLDAPCYCLAVTISIALTGSGASGQIFFVDIGIGAPGSEVVMVPDIAIRNITAVILRETCVGPIELPVSLPAGTRIAVRGQGAAEGGGRGSVSIQAMSPALTGPHSAQLTGGFVQYGADPVAKTMLSVTTGLRVITTATARRHRGLICVFSPTVASSVFATQHIWVGTPAQNHIRFSRHLRWWVGSTEVNGPVPSMFAPLDIPAGSWLGWSQSGFSTAEYACIVGVS